VVRAVENLWKSQNAAYSWGFCRAWCGNLLVADGGGAFHVEQCCPEENDGGGCAFRGVFHVEHSHMGKGDGDSAEQMAGYRPGSFSSIDAVLVVEAEKGDDR
jgi:hypothetical protein